MAPKRYEENKRNELEHYGEKIKKAAMKEGEKL